MAFVTLHTRGNHRYGCRMALPSGGYGRLNTAVARILSEARDDLGLTTRQMAETTGIERVTMLRYLNDQRAIDMDRLYRLSTAVGLTPNEVIERASALIRAEDAAGA